MSPLPPEPRGLANRWLAQLENPELRRAMPALAVWLVLVWGAPRAGAQEWTRFRGPNGTGIAAASSIPSQWTSSDWSWQLDLPGKGHSSPVVWGERLFLTSAEQDGAQRLVLAIQVSDGRILWTQRFLGSEHTKHQLNSFASPTPCVDAERVYVSWSSPESYLVVALDHAGNEAWRCDLGPYVSQHSAGPSPIVYENLLIVGNDQDGESFLVALDKTSGQVVWKTPRRSDHVSYATPCVYERPGGTPELVFLSGAHGVSGLDPRTGAVFWELAAFDKRTVASPVCGEGLVLGSCGSGAGGNYVVAVRPGQNGGVPAELAFKIEKSANYVPTPIVYGSRLFLWSDQGVASCVQLPTGKILWQRRVGGNYFGSPIWLDGRLVSMSSDGEVVIIAAADEYELLGRIELEELSHSTPAVAGGRLFLRTESRLHALGPEPGATK